MKKIIIYVIILFLFLFLGLVIFLYYCPDNTVVDDNDFKVECQKFSEAENSYNDWLEAEKLLLMDSEDVGFVNEFLQNRSDDFVKANEILESNKNSVELLESGLSKKYFQNPVYCELDSFDVTTSVLESDVLSMKLPRLGLLKMKLLFDGGDEDGAIEYGGNILKMGWVIEKSNDVLLQKTIGKSIRIQANRIVFDRVIDNQMNIEQIDSWLEYMDKYPSDVKSEVNGLRMEYFGLKSAIINNMINGFDSDLCEKVVGEDLSVSFCWLSKFGYYWQVNATLNYLADYYRCVIDNSGESYSGIADCRVDNANNGGVVTDLFTENVVGKTWITYYSNLMDYFYRQSDEKYSNLFEEGAIYVILKLKKYEIENGKLPQYLNELVDRDDIYFVDPYNGEQIVYKPNQKTIYSVGKNLIDDDGDLEKDIVYQF